MNNFFFPLITPTLSANPIGFILKQYLEYDFFFFYHVYCCQPNPSHHHFLYFKVSYLVSLLLPLPHTIHFQHNSQREYVKTLDHITPFFQTLQ